MRAIHGKTGRTGYPARLHMVDLSKYGVRRNGTLQIATREGTSSEALVWFAEERSEPAESGFFDRNYPLVEPQRDELLSTDDFLNIPAFLKRELHEAPGEYSVRLRGPVQFVWKLLEFWRLEAHDAVGLLGFDSEDTDYVSAVLCGLEHFRGRDLRDRISHLFWIRKTLWSLFRDLDVENEWLREPHSMLDDRSPLSLLVGGSMEDLLLTREYVDAASGR